MGDGGMLDEITEIETPDNAQQPNPRASASSKAIRYLEASGAVAIYVTCPADFVPVRVGKIGPHAVAIFWLNSHQAVAVARLARRLAGADSDRDDAVLALREAAAELGVTLTPHDTAISRAAAAVERLDAFMDSLRANGGYRAFTKEYKRRRLAARERGEGFMTFKVAEARLRAALVPLLIGGKPVLGASLFAEVFKTGHRDTSA
jgi:hypothetical protein